MTKLIQFKTGEFLFRQGDPSDRVLRVKSGEIGILRQVGVTSVLLGHVREGDWLGEIGVIEHRTRSASARAATEGEAEVFTAAQFLEQVSSDPALARDLVQRLSVRVRRVEDRLTGDLPPFAQERSMEGVDKTASNTAIAQDARISVTAQSDFLRGRIGAAPIKVAKLPFIVGRVPFEDEPRPSRRPDLLIEDDEPFRLSRQHFMIERSGDRLLVSDLGSTLGTIVNQQAIGHLFMTDAAPLHRGENKILAGGWDSAFEFLVSVD